jgi:hypothetical protein
LVTAAVGLGISIMTFYHLEIRYPQHISDADTQRFEQLDALDIESKFDAMNWHRQWVLQLELESHDSSFMVTDLSSGKSIRLSLKCYANMETLCFKLDSDIEMVTSRRDLFGLIKLKHKDYVGFEGLSLLEARHYLSQFLSQQFDGLIDHYQATLPQTSKA